MLRRAGRRTARLIPKGISPAIGLHDSQDQRKGFGGAAVLAQIHHNSPPLKSTIYRVAIDPIFL